MEHFADIAGPVRIGLMGIILLAAGLVLLVSGIALVIHLLLKRRKKAGPGVTQPTRSPLEIALERLRFLKSSMSQLAAEPFTVEVSDVVRDYLESSLKIPAREQTSEEFLLQLQDRQDLPPVLDEHMPAFLEQCDRVKFALQTLEEKQRDTLLDTAESVVESTDRHLHPEQQPGIPNPATR